MTDKELSEALNEWFKHQSKGCRLRGPVWEVLKSHLFRLRHWKNCPRGDPKALKEYMDGKITTNYGDY